MNLHIKKETIDEETTLRLIKDDREIGKAVINEIDSDFFIESEDHLIQTFGMDEVVIAVENSGFIYDFNWIQIEKEERGYGYGSFLLDEAISTLKELAGDGPVFLNACPFDSDVTVGKLLKIYQEKGFHSVADQGGNVIMFVDSAESLQGKEDKISSSLDLESEDYTPEVTSSPNNK